MLTFEVPSVEDFEFARVWRNTYLVSLRTPIGLTKEMQEDFYKNKICNRQSEHRFWSINLNDNTIGLIGFVGIQWENRLAEISIILDPSKTRCGYGSQAFHMLLDKGFNYLNFDNIYGEYYLCNPYIGYWEKICNNYSAYQTKLPNRKYWAGRYWDAIYFNINKDNFINRKEKYNGKKN